MAWSFPFKVDVVARKLAVVNPAGIVKPGGTVSAGLLLESAVLTVSVAALFSETVQVVVALLPREAGEQDTDES